MSRKRWVFGKRLLMLEMAVPSPTGKRKGYQASFFLTKAMFLIAVFYLVLILGKQNPLLELLFYSP